MNREKVPHTQFLLLVVAGAAGIIGRFLTGYWIKNTSSFKG